MSVPGHLALFAWLSPSFPIGAFAYSHGLETAVSDGDVRDGATLQAWLFDLLRLRFDPHGSDPCRLRRKGARRRATRMAFER